MNHRTGLDRVQLRTVLGWEVWAGSAGRLESRPNPRTGMSALQVAQAFQSRMAGFWGLSSPQFKNSAKLRPLDRAQTLLFPEFLEDYVAAENPVRFLDAFVGTLDLHALGFVRAQCAATGRKNLSPWFPPLR